jgi:uncharacterized protein
MMKDDEFFDESAKFRPRSPYRAASPRFSRTLMGVLGLLALLLIVWPMWVSYHTTWLWFDQLGYLTVFTTVLLTKLVLGVTAALLAAGVALLNFKLALRQSPDQPYNRRVIRIEGQEAALPDLGQIPRKLVWPAAILIGLFLGSIAWAAWDILLRFRHRTAFGEADPIFGRDIAFYFFTLPALEVLSQWLLLLVLACLVGVGVIYGLRGSVQWSERAGLSLAHRPRIHLLSLVAAFFLVLAWQAYLGVPDLLYSTEGPVAGAGYTDINARLPLLYVQIGTAVLVAVLALVSAWRTGNGLLFAGLGLFALVLVSGWVYPAFVQRFSVAPNELAKETPYIIHNIAATRKAFGLDKVEERELTGEAALSAQDIRKNQPTINNIRLWDQGPLLDTFSQIQEIRTYYDFASVDNDRYRVNGELRQVMLSPRELASSSLPNRNWINEHLTFTHGFGLTLGPVNQVTPEGLPVLFIKDIPPVSNAPELKVERPEIYFGELSNDRVYVKTTAKEFDYPAGEQNVFANYEGEGGVAIGSTWRQLLFSTRFGDMKLLLSNDLTSESRVLFHRNIRERLTQVAPFVTFDSDPYLVISEGRLFWIADAYTTSNRYPYSQPQDVTNMGRVNYIRNSVKAVVDAYHGHVRLYIADESDPLVQTWARIFPGILKPLSEMPPDLRAHLRYPEDIFKIQTAVYSTWHMDQPQVFYNKEDQWSVAVMSEKQGTGEAQTMEPYYTVMKLPGEQSEEFILMLPFTPKNKDNLAAWMVARADAEHYGKLVVYRFPKQKLIFGPKQIVGRINQDPEISRQVSLWNQRGSTVIPGTLMVIPVEESLIYVQPLYLRAETGRIPELRRVIVAAENQIAMEPTLEASLGRIFGTAPAAAPPAPGATDPVQAAQPGAPPAAPPAAGTQNLAEQARQHYDRAIQAQRAGDWARYGEEIKQLGAVLEQMARQR